jgi:5'-nucleotidase
MANILEDGKPIANAAPYVVKNCKDSTGNDIRVGIIGLAEEDWLSTVPQLPPVTFLNFVDEGRRLAKFLRETEGCSLIIALTHMRLENDIVLADSVPEIDLVLGGHDHFYRIYPTLATDTSGNEYEGAIRVVKSGLIVILLSGSDFKGFSVIEIPSIGPKDKIRVKHKIIDSTIVENPEMIKLVAESIGEQFAKMKKAIAELLVPIDTRSEIVRLGESNIGSYACDIVRTAYETDVAFLCGGAIRSDTIYTGMFTIRDLLDIFPFKDATVVLEISGQGILKALEHGFSAFPKTEGTEYVDFILGRFPQIGGMRVRYNSSLPSGSRVVSCKIVSNNYESCESVPIDPKKMYTLATRHYLANGINRFT